MSEAQPRAILHMLEPNKHMSPFDVNMAADAGYETIVPYTNVTLEEVRPLTQDAIFSRPPHYGLRTGFFIGGKDAIMALDMLKAAEEALVKIGAVLPDDLRSVVGAVGIGVPGYRIGPDERERVDRIETAIARRQVLVLDYEDKDGQATERRVHPLVLTFWGGHWTVIGWCLLRSDFRMFRLHRMRRMTLSDETFRPAKGQRLIDFRQRMIDSGELSEGFDFSLLGL